MVEKPSDYPGTNLIAAILALGVVVYYVPEAVADPERRLYSIIVSITYGCLGLAFFLMWRKRRRRGSP